MGEEKKNSPSVGAPGEQMEIANFGEPAVSDFQYTTPTGEISRFLLRGQKNAVSLRQLEALTGWDGRKEILTTAASIETASAGGEN